MTILTYHLSKDADSVPCRAANAWLGGETRHNRQDGNEQNPPMRMPVVFSFLDSFTAILCGFLIVDRAVEAWGLILVVEQCSVCWTNDSVGGEGILYHVSGRHGIVRPIANLTPFGGNIRLMEFEVAKASEGKRKTGYGQMSAQTKEVLRLGTHLQSLVGQFR